MTALPTTAFSRKQKLSLRSGRLLTLWMMRKYRDFGRLSSTSVIQTSCAMLSESSTKCFRNGQSLSNISPLRSRSKELVYERAFVLIFELSRVQIPQSQKVCVGVPPMRYYLVLSWNGQRV